MHAQDLDPSHRAVHRYWARKFMITIYFSWFLALAIGTLNYAGVDAVNKNELPLRVFDAFFKRAGGLIIFTAWAIRAVIKHTLHIRGDGRREYVWIPAVFYTLQAGLRSVFYQLHRLGILLDPLIWWTTAVAEERMIVHHPHIMSDHILLAATVVGGLTCEMVVLYLSLAHRRSKMSPILLKSLATAVTALAILVSVECYFTARYFHPPSEIITGAVLGLVVFQAPLLLFSARLLRQHEEKDGVERVWSHASSEGTEAKKTY